MADESKRFWKSLRQRDRDPEFLAAARDEFAEKLDTPAVQLPRRDFLKLAAVAAGVATAVGCTRAPVEKAIPLLVGDEEIVPGRSLMYATSCGACSASCGALAKVRDGRPIKLEGNPGHAASRGGLCAIGQASIYGLYDAQRYRNPRKQGAETSWAILDSEVTAELEKLRQQKAKVRFLTGTITSPTLSGAIGDFLRRFADGKHVVYDAISSSAILEAHERTHGARLLPHYHFDRADAIASFDADFLGTWISPVEFTAAYQAGRDLNAAPPRMSWHVQFEPRMTITGAKADRRVAVSPAEVAATLAQVAQRIAVRAGASFSAAGLETSVPSAVLEAVADRLWKARGRSLVVSGSQDVDVQVLVNFINHALGNYGATIEVDAPSNQKQGNDGELAALLQEIAAGEVSALLIHGANPVFNLPQGEALAKALELVPLVVNFAGRADETAQVSAYVAPDHHYLESWSDAEPVAGSVAVVQPTIRPLFNTRSVLESLAAWSGAPKPMYDIVREQWRRSIFPRQTKERSFETFWENAVQAGAAEVSAVAPKLKPFNLSSLRRPSAAAEAGYTLVLYPKVAMGDGTHAYNAFLHELPDPISKVTWDNCANVSPATASKLGVREGDTLVIATKEDAGARKLVLPVYVQPGHHDSVISVALGYGSMLSRRFASEGPTWIDKQPSVNAAGVVGANAAPFLRLEHATLRYERGGVDVVRGSERRPVAVTQEHNTLSEPRPAVPGFAEPRDIIQQSVLPVLAAEAGKPRSKPKAGAEIWPADHPYTGHRWAMAVDLTACTGCSSCVVACQVENNIPVVGKDEIRRNREMHWLRIDRYFGDAPDGQVDVAFQPMMCQQCENAPCETVCPVLATVHSEEGLNQQVYNRCVGTRYCANNCPYKARRFNWFDYARNDKVENLALNPDVAVRTRGVMEKCTFCVQRIQEQKIAAKTRGDNTIADGAVQTACQQSCPAQAIVFGDLNDPSSKVAQLAQSARGYRVLEEFGVGPSVAYLELVRNRDEGEGENHG